MSPRVHGQDVEGMGKGESREEKYLAVTLASVGIGLTGQSDRWNASVVGYSVLLGFATLELLEMDSGASTTFCGARVIRATRLRIRTCAD